MRCVGDGKAGIGLRGNHIPQLLEEPKREDIDFLELSPDNWMNIGGEKEEVLSKIAQKYPLIAHSLCLSIGDTCPLNTEYVTNIRHFLDKYHIDIYGDHLCFSRDSQGYLYDLLPIPMLKENLPYITDRIKQVQDIIGRQLVLENISAYHSYGNEMKEWDFWHELLHYSGCGMLLDINNIYVNSINHGFDAQEYIESIPSDSIVYYHIAGHVEIEELLVDTHGADVCQGVRDFAKKVLQMHGAKPLLLERDNNVPPLNELCEELSSIRAYLSEK